MYKQLHLRQLGLIIDSDKSCCQFSCMMTFDFYKIGMCSQVQLYGVSENITPQLETKIIVTCVLLVLERKAKIVGICYPYIIFL